MNFIEKWFIEKGGSAMLTKLWDALNGWKTHILAGLGIFIALAGHFWGPFNLGSLTVPQFQWGDVWQIIWNGGLFSALHAKKP